MTQHAYTPTEKARIHRKQRDRRRRDWQRREGEFRRRIERLRRQIEQARKRRQWLLLLILIAILTMQKSLSAAFARLVSYPADPITDDVDWMPDPLNDYAPRRDSDDFCDGYSRAQWDRMAEKRGFRVNRKAQLKAEWEADPDWGRFPERYQQWDYRPFLGEIFNDLRQQRWQSDALAALKLLSPQEVNQYIEEAFYLNPADLRQCNAQRDREIVAALRSRAILWEECKRRDAELSRPDKESREKIDDDPEGPQIV